MQTGLFPRFGATIRVVDQAAFEATCNRQPGQEVGYPWTIEERIIKAPAAITRDAVICNVGGVSNGKQVALSHIIPAPLRWYLPGFSVDHGKIDEHTLDEMDRVLGRDYLDLQGGGNRLKGFLAGGKPDDEGSVLLKNRFRQVFHRLGIPFSRLWGQRGEYMSTDVHYAADTDTWTVHPKTGKDYMDVPQSFKPQGKTPEEILDGFRQFYQDITLAPGDRLEIHGVEIPREVLKTECHPAKELCA